jgi:hypothetical protein
MRPEVRRKNCHMTVMPFSTSYERKTTKKIKYFVFIIHYVIAINYASLPTQKFARLSFLYYWLQKTKQKKEKRLACPLMTSLRKWREVQTSRQRGHVISQLSFRTERRTQTGGRQPRRFTPSDAKRGKLINVIPAVLSPLEMRFLSQLLWLSYCWRQRGLSDLLHWNLF